MRKLFLALPAFALGLLTSLIGSCTIANPNHCYNLGIDTNAWCAAVHPEQPYCSPCEADNNGCVADEPDPDDCPAYTAPQESGTGTETAGTETGDTGGTETETSAG